MFIPAFNGGKVNKYCMVTNFCERDALSVLEIYLEIVVYFREYENS